MYKISLLIASILLTIYSFAQTKQQKKQLATMHLAGKYEYGTSAEKEEVGLAYIYAESDSTILFYLDLNAGPPSLSMGSLYGRVKIKNEKGIFESANEAGEDSCKFLLKFKANKLIIETVNSQYNCGFGHAVYADGTFKRISKKNSAYFLNQESNEVYFKDLKL